MATAVTMDMAPRPWPGPSLGPVLGPGPVGPAGPGPGQAGPTGWPAGLHSLSEVGIFAVVPVMAGWINATAQAAHQVAISTASAAFMLPLGYSFNLDGSMMYMTFASIFIAQVYGVDLDTGTQLTMLLVLMLTSKGIAGVPRASLVVVAATCGMFNIPIEGVALILPIDHFCDMFRSATNVLGNSVATAVVGKWESKNG